MKNFILLISVVICTATSPSLASTISSTFDADAEGWTANAPEGALAHVASGGNPDGHIRVTDTGGGGVNGFASGAFFGPAFSGDLRAFDGGTLSIDMNATVVGGGNFDSFGWILLFGPGDAMPDDQTPEAMADIAPQPPRGPTWVTFTMTFDAATFGLSQLDWEDLVSDIDRIGIATDAFDGADTIGIDNVTLRASAANPVPLPASGWLVLLSVALIRAVRRRG